MRGGEREFGEKNVGVVWGVGGGGRGEKGTPAIKNPIGKGRRKRIRGKKRRSGVGCGRGGGEGKKERLL